MSTAQRFMPVQKKDADRMVTDGRTYGGHRDAPGQSSVYIAPGDVWKERYRLSTFAQYPEESPVLPTHLASSGFHYTGYKDRVRCFSCGLCVENWMLGDDPRDRKWHRTDCDFINGRDVLNQPLLGAFSQFRLTCVTSSSHSINSHTTHGQDVPATLRNRSSPTTVSTGSGGSVDRQDVFPCLDPVNPHMRSAARRLETFKPHNGVRWPRERLAATPEDLVNAGFFYLGERDRVKCWYCNGGLQNWDYEDEPWTEHAKWFPTCQFVLRMRGRGFVESIVSQCPNLNRPVPPVPSRPAENEPRRYALPSASTQSSSTQAPSSGGAVSAVEQGMAKLKYVEHAREMGFTDDHIRAVLRMKHDRSGQFYSTTEEFLEAIFLYQASFSGGAGATRVNTPLTHANSAPVSTGSQLEALKNTRMCGICRNAIRSVVLTPCGHLACCEPCSVGLKKCPLCNRPVRDVIKTFRA